MGHSDGVRSVRIIFEVVGGLIPGRPEQEFTKQFYIFSDDWHAAQDHYELIDAVRKEAEEYAASLMDPRRLNWVRTDWVYL